MGNFIVTGGGSGIGQALAFELADKGHTVMVVGRTIAALATTKAYCPQQIITLASDLATPKGRDRLCAAVSAWPSINGLIHNAATLAPISPINALSLTDWRAMMAINVEAPLFLTKALLPKLHAGRVLHLSSGLRDIAMPSLAPYSVSKAALFMLYQCMNVEFEGIAVGSLKPGIVDTKMQSELRKAKALPVDDRSFYQALKTNEKLVSPQTVARMITWLLLEVDAARFSAHEWDIYEPSHHGDWLADGFLPELNL